MTEQAQPKKPQDQEICAHARIWRAIDRLATGTERGSLERKAEYTARQQLRDVIDQASKGER